MTTDEINSIIEFLNKTGLLKNIKNDDMKKILENYSNITQSNNNFENTISDLTSKNQDLDSLIESSNKKLKESLCEPIIESNIQLNDFTQNSTNDSIEESTNHNFESSNNDSESSNNDSKSTNNDSNSNTVSKYDTIRNTLKDLREKIESSQNKLNDTTDRINDKYLSKLDNIKNNIQKCINIEKDKLDSPIPLSQKHNIPPLDLSQINDDKKSELHKKILHRSESYTSKLNPHIRYPPTPTPTPTPTPLQDPRFNPYLTNRHLPQVGPLTDRYNSLTDRPAPFADRRRPTITDRYPMLNRPYEPRFTDYRKDRQLDFDELCKKYEIEGIPSRYSDRYNDKLGDEHEIIITTNLPPNSNPLDIINGAIDKFEKELYDKKDDKFSLRNIFEKFKNQKKKSTPKYDKDELLYYDSLSTEKKAKIDKLEDKISNINNIKTPLRFKVLQSNLPLHNKSMIINKIEDLFSNKLLGGGSETTKYSNWVNSLLKVPFKKYKKLPINTEVSDEKDIGKYLIDVKKTLDSAVYGHTSTKEQVIQIIAQWITNPNSIGNCIGIQGVMGNGKTTLVKNGIAKAIDRPFAFITLGGCSDASFLEGHNYTYEGSMWGKIVDVLVECKCMNPVFYFDELDKVSETPKGEEIINSLIHLTDASQNSQYSDKYFNGVDFDISKSLFIFSFNDMSKINPILLDRLMCIKTDEFKLDDKIHIAQNYLLKEIFEQLKIKKDTYKITDDNIKYIIEKYTDNEGGVRTLKKNLYNIFSKFNLLNLTQNDDSIEYTFDLDKKLLNKKEITNDIIDKFLNTDKNKSEDDEYYKTFYI